MSQLRIAHISYLNSVPFFAGMEDAELELVDMHPHALGRAAEEGSIDAGLMSIADTFRNPEYEPLGDLGIALDGAAHSVLLFSSSPVEELDGATIGITGETSTSYPLLRLLLDGYFEVSPLSYERRSEGPDASDDAILLIGDAALRRAAASGLEPGRRDYSGGILELGTDRFSEPYQHVLDLAALWKRWRGLPFVFARWMVRRGVDRADRLMLAEMILETLNANLHHLYELAEEHAARAGLSAEGAFVYLMGFTYQFGRTGEESIETFRTMLESTQWWETAPPAILESEGA